MIDFDKNVEYAHRFISGFKLKSDKPEYFGLGINLSHDSSNKPSLVMFSYCPPRKYQMGNYATPVLLMNPLDKFKEEMKIGFETYAYLAKKTNERCKVFWTEQKLLSKNLFKSSRID